MSLVKSMSTIMVVQTLEMSPLEFQGGTFDAIKIFVEKFFTGSSTGYKPEISMFKGGYETSELLSTKFFIASKVPS